MFKYLKELLKASFSVYKNKKEIAKDFLRPLYGISNLLLGSFAALGLLLCFVLPPLPVVGVPAIVICNMAGILIPTWELITIMSAAVVSSFFIILIDELELNPIALHDFLVKACYNNMGSLVVGAIQLLTSPFLLVTIPLRLFLTYRDSKSLPPQDVTEQQISRGLQEQEPCSDAGKSSVISPVITLGRRQQATPTTTVDSRSSRPSETKVTPK